METEYTPELYPFSYKEFETDLQDLSDNQLDIRALNTRLVEQYKKEGYLEGPYGVRKLTEHLYGMDVKIDDYPFYIFRFFAPQNYIFLNPNPEIDHTDEPVKSSLDIPASFALMRESFAISDLTNLLNTKLMPNPYDDMMQFYRTAFLRWFWWSSLCDTILSYLSILSETLLSTRHFGMDEPDGAVVGGFFTLITGGLALRSYYPSHYSDDIDVKFFPRNMIAEIDSNRFFSDLSLWMNELMIPYLNTYGKYLLQTYLQIVLQFPEIRQNVMMRYLYTELANSSPEDFSFEFSQAPTPNVVVYKLIVRFKGVIYPIADFTLYDSEDKIYNNLIRESREKSGEFDAGELKEKYGIQFASRDPEKALIPFNVVSNVYLIPEVDIQNKDFKMAFNPIPLNRKVLDTVEDEGNIGMMNGVRYRKTVGRFMIPTKEYLRAEKEILLNDLPNPEEFENVVENPDILEDMETPYFRFNRPRNANENKFFVEKFAKTLRTIQENEEELLERVYVGGERSE